MSSIVLRPRSSTELVDASIQVYKREPVTFILAMALLYVPWLVLRLAIGVSAEDPFALSPIQSGIAAVAFMIVYVFSGGVTTIVASDVYLGKRPDLRAAFQLIGTNFVRLLVTLLVVGILTVIGGMLFFFPALYVVTRYFSVKQIVLLEGKGIGDSLSRASQLSIDQKWHIFKTIALMFLVIMAINFGALFLVGLIPSKVLGEVLSAAITTVVVPMFGITQTLLYYDLRIRKEGFDVEYLAAQATGDGLVVGSAPAAR